VAPTRPMHRDLIMRTLENVEGMSVAALQAGLGTEWPFETFPEYLDVVEQRGCAVNVAALIGHTALRMYVMGEDSVERDATPEEIAAQKDLLREALAAGALGFATSKANTHVGYDGKPVPSRMAQPEEIFAIAAALGEVPNAVMQATIGRGLSHNEFAHIAELTGKAVSWTALLSGQPRQDYREELRKAAEIQARGLRVFPQVAVQPVQFEMNWKAPFIYEALSCFKPVSAAGLDGRKALYADPDWRETFKEKAGKGGIIYDRWARTTVSWYPTDTSFEGRNVQELADHLGKDPVDVMMDMALDADLEMRITQDVINYDPDDIQVLLSDPTTVIGLSDAGAHASQLCDACYSTHLLGHWVRERGALTLEDAVWRLTGHPHVAFRIADRGLVQEGFFADLVAFDPVTVGTTPVERVHDQPGGADRLLVGSIGIEHVWVNGVATRRHGTDLDQVRPGRLLRT
jgi:N-acyl-D-amino-acid deacylase